MSGPSHIDPETRIRFERALRKLPPLQRDILLAHMRDELSYAEIGELTGLRVNQVERHMARAIYKLFKQLDGDRLSWWERWFR